MPYYRLYTMNHLNAIRSFSEADCPDDESAIAHARAGLGMEVVELWNRSRKVARLEPDGQVTIEVARRPQADAS